ncbi:AraC family transcriptional regulator [Calidifontibacillus oryziterrae]|uniref:AraC family transcriptional regulator n=1 Tax=Calidifontibacillus oryziterrae TaxID=1191699 RepID=UPI00030A78D5|nr:AraC family transcriptional regulator [Calidifontibacillus oryziterrae]
MRPETIEFTDGLPVKAFVRSIEQYPYHWHDTLEIIQVLKGSVHVGLGNDNLLLKENDIAVINIGELHRITKSEQDNEVLILQIDASFCRDVLPENEYFFIYCCSPYHESEVPEKYKIVKETIAQLLKALSEGPTGNSKDTIHNILTNMIAYLNYSFDFLRWGYGITPFSEKLVERLKKIAGHASGEQEVQLGLKALADEVGVTLHHLSHDIKDKFGFTFQELLYYSKCEQAAKLLLSTERRVIDIAMECGFSDVKYLIKHFKQNFQCTPSEFRKKHQADKKSLASQVKFHDCPLVESIHITKI